MLQLCCPARCMKPCVFLVIPTLVVRPKVLAHTMALKAGKYASTSFAESPLLISHLAMGKKLFVQPEIAGLKQLLIDQF